MNKNNYGIIISSCDAYSDAWGPFFTLFFRYWPDCPFPVYLISNYKEYRDPRIIPIKVGEDKKWATNMKMALEIAGCSSVIYFQEDYFLQSRVNTEFIEELIYYAESNNISCLRLFPSPPPDIFFKNSLNLGQISKDAAYRVSLQAALWKSEDLKDLVCEGESGWDMEYNGTLRSIGKGLFVSVKEPALDYLAQTGIVKGKWTVEAVKLCKKEGIEIDLSKRAVNHKINFRSMLDRLRKRSWVQKIKKIPFIGKVASKIFWKFCKLFRRVDY